METRYYYYTATRKDKRKPGLWAISTVHPLMLMSDEKSEIECVTFWKEIPESIAVVLIKRFKRIGN